MLSHTQTSSGASLFVVFLGVPLEIKYNQIPERSALSFPWLEVFAVDSQDSVACLQYWQNTLVTGGSDGQVGSQLRGGQFWLKQTEPEPL